MKYILCDKHTHDAPGGIKGCLLCMIDDLRCTEDRRFSQLEERDKIAAERDKHVAELAIVRTKYRNLKEAHKNLQKERDELKAEPSKPRCEHCGSNRIYSGPPDCPRCGAPNCCEMCCNVEFRERLLDTAEAQLSKVRAQRDHELRMKRKAQANITTLHAELETARATLDNLRDLRAVVLILLDSHGCWRDGPESAEVISADFDIGIDRARHIIEIWEAADGK